MRIRLLQQGAEAYCHRGQEPANARDNTVSKSLFLTGSFSTTVTNHFISIFIPQNVLWSRERLSLHRQVLVEAVCRLHRGQPRMRHARLFCRTLSISHTNSFRRNADDMPTPALQIQVVDIQSNSVTVGAPCQKFLYLTQISCCSCSMKQKTRRHSTSPACDSDK